MNPHKAVDYIIENAGKFAAAKANRVWIEEFRKSKKALLMKDSKEKTNAGQERDAYAHPEYVALLDGLKAAVEIEETIKWEMIAAQARIDIWRSEQANNRNQDRSMT
tara:strand:+ start:295 stop:615 length:321 start_codon:yes stop_codon:yes gene_type:complete